MTTRFALSRAEWATTALAVVVSVTAFLAYGAPYLARGVVGDLVGFALLSIVGLVRGARVQHEALVCLVCIGVVVAVSPDWPLRVASGVWWLLFVLGLVAYVGVRRRLCR